jgi:hypothetical protein
MRHSTPIFECFAIKQLRDKVIRCIIKSCFLEVSVSKSKLTSGMLFNIQGYSSVTESLQSPSCYNQLDSIK